MDTGDRSGNLACDECSSTARGLVVEEDTVRQMHAISLTVVDQDPESVLLGDSVRGTRVEWCGLGLRNLAHLAVKLGGGSLVKSDSLLHTGSADGIEHAEDTDSVAVSRVFRHVEGHHDVTHGTQVVDLGRLDVVDDGNEVGGIAQVSVMQENLDSSLMAISVDVLNTSCVEATGTTDNSVDL